MATYYLRATNGSDSNSGADWANAVKTLAALQALMTTNGDIGLCDIESETSQIISSTVNFGTVSVTLKGVDQTSGDPKTFTVDGNSTAQDCLFFDTSNCVLMDFICKNATRYGVVPGVSSDFGTILIRVKTENCGTAGFFAGDYDTFWMCGDEGSPIGTEGGIGSKYFYCKFEGNTTYGANMEPASSFHECEFNNCAEGIRISATQAGEIRNCVFYDCDEGVYSTLAITGYTLVGNRFEDCTNYSIRFTSTSAYGLLAYNTYYNNGGKTEQNATELGEVDSTATNFVSAGTGDLSTKPDADNVSIETFLGIDTSGSKSVWDAGLQSELSVGGGGTKSVFGEILGVKRGII